MPQKKVVNPCYIKKDLITDTLGLIRPRIIIRGVSYRKRKYKDASRAYAIIGECEVIGYKICLKRK